MTTHHDHRDPPPPLALAENDNSPNNLDNDNDLCCYTPTRAQEIVRERHQVDMSKNENMDPIEWTVRKLVPIPAVYYWDVSVVMPSNDKEQDNTTLNNDNTMNEISNDQIMTNDDASKTAPPTPQHQPMSADMVPWKIRLWHESIYSLSRAGDLITRWIAQPIAGALGLTHSSPFSYVFDNMTQQEWEASQKRAIEQRRKNQQRREHQQEQQQAEQVPAPEQTECPEDKI